MMTFAKNKTVLVLKTLKLLLCMNTLVVFCMHTACAQNIIRAGSKNKTTNQYKYGFNVRDIKGEIRTRKRDVVWFIQNAPQDTALYKTSDNKIVSFFPIEDSTHSNIPQCIQDTFKVINVEEKKDNFFVKNNRLKREKIFLYDVEPLNVKKSTVKYIRILVLQHEKVVKSKSLKLGKYYHLVLTPLLTKDCCNPNFTVKGTDTTYMLRQSRSLYTYIIKGVLIPKFSFNDYNIVEINSMTLVDVRNQKTIQKTDRANTNYYFYKKVNLRMGRKRKITLVFKKKSESMQDIRSFYDYVSNIKGVTNLIGILASSDRTYKLTGNLIAQNIGGVWHHYMQLDNPTLYASPYLVATKHGYTKHYYAENERLLCKIGDGTIEGIDLHVVDTATLARKQTAVNQTLPNGQYTSSLSNLATLDGTQGKHPELYWQHSDHLGSASWITDTAGRAIQHLQYMPWGEPLLDYRNPSSSYSARYTFSGKERDAETGYSYFGARYYNSDYSIWLSVDPMSDKYPSLSPYVYCGNNPVKLVDPSGKDIYEFDEHGKYIGIRKGSEGSPDQIAIIKGTNIIESKKYEKGTINAVITDRGSVKTSYETMNAEYKYFDVHNDDVASEIFEFAAQNSECEWAHIQFGENENRIGTSGVQTQDPAGSLIVKAFIKNGISVRKDIHSHPDVPAIVPTPGIGDMFYAKYAKETYGDKAPPMYVYGKTRTDSHTREGDNWEYIPYSFYGKSFQLAKIYYIRESVDSSRLFKKISPLVISDSSFYHILDKYFAIKIYGRGHVLLIDIKRSVRRGYSIKLMIIDTAYLDIAVQREFKSKKRFVGYSEIGHVTCFVFGCFNPIFRKDPQGFCEYSSIIERVVSSLTTAKQRQKSIWNLYNNLYNNEENDYPPVRTNHNIFYFFYKDGEYIPRFYKGFI